MNLSKNSNRLLSAIALFLIICFLMKGSIFAQTTLVTLEGMISDEERNALQGATIVVTNIETGYVHTGISRSDGRYIISGIQPGKYQCEVSLSGFTTRLRRGLTFNVGSRLEINFTLTPAALKEEVTVTAESPMVEVSKSEISSIVNRQKIDDLPLLDRDFDVLSITKAGVQTSELGDIKGNAQPSGYGEMLIDGVSNESTPQAGVRAAIPADAIEEFRVVTNQYEAEYGNVSGLLRNAITRSGTNELRGRVSFFYRDDTLDDVNYFVNHTRYKSEELPEDQWEKPPYSHFNFGGFLGGPIVKDKAHFFIAYEGLRRKEYSTITSPLVPQETVEVPSSNNKILAKISYQLSDQHIFTVRYGLDRPKNENLWVGGIWSKEQAYDSTSTVHDIQANWTYYVSDRSMNELRILYSHEFGDITVPKGLEDSYFIVRPSGFEGSLPSYPQWNKISRYQAVDNFSLFVKDHTIKVGVDASYVPWHAHIPQYMPGMFVFLTDEPFDAANPDTYPLLFQYDVGRFDLTYPYWAVGAFIQDSWRVSPRLTLNYGIRYNYYYCKGSKLASWNIRNLNPRLGFSLDPIGDGKTVIRGGIGTYSANPMAELSGYTQFMSGVEEHVVFFPNYPDPFQPNPFFPPVPGTTSETIFDQKDGQIPPYTLQVTIGGQREVITDLSIGADLVFARGYRLFFQSQLNPVIPGTSYVRRDPCIGDWFRIVDWGKSDYKALYFTLNKRYSHGWSLEVSYTLSKSMADTEDWFSRQDNYEDMEKKFMWGPTSLDARHRIAITGLVDLPVGIQLSGLLYYRSALPWNAIYSYDKNTDSLVSDYVDEYRNSRRGFDEFYLNLRLSKYFNIDRIRLQFFADAYNITNRANFMAIFNQYNDLNPDATPLFGEPLQAGDPRLIQFGVRIDF